MDMMELAGMLFTLLVVGMIGSLILLFPLARRLGALLEQRLLQAKQAESVDPQAVAELRRAVHALEAETKRLAEQQEFTQALLESGEPGARAPTRELPTRATQPPRA
ncbi:MAG: hypothetical protein M3P51_14090 [Chloroflexota bacterium]|nr:hypothetical protein [Chloroflexota bacterium]